MPAAMAAIPIAGAIASAVVGSNAQSNASATQAKSLQRAKEYAATNMDPAVVNAQALAADKARLANRMALQAQVDPALAQLRGQAGQQLLEQTAGIGQGNANTLANLATQNAVDSNDQTTDLKNRLIDAALAELDAGATLPPDVQAELVKAGLERSGMVTGGANTRGVGGTLVREQIGTGALALKAQRQAQAQQLISTASNLDTQRQQILASLFPSLNSVQLQNMNASAGALGVSQAAMPEAGLSGTNIAELWLARIGAVNKLNQSAADVKSSGQLAQAQIINSAIGSATSQGSMSNLMSGFGTPTPGSTADYNTMGSNIKLS